MADTKISGLPASTVPLAGTEVLPIVQGSTTKQVSVANLTAGRAISASNVTNSALTSGRVTYAGTSGILQDSANFTFNGTTVTTANDASISGLTVGKGLGAVASNTAIGFQALRATTTAAENTAVGYQANYSSTTSGGNTSLGFQANYTNSTSANNTAIGSYALYANTAASNTAVGVATLSNSTGARNVGMGVSAGAGVTTGTNNVILGFQAGNDGGTNLTTGSNNIIIGYNAVSTSATVSNEVTLGNSSITLLRVPGITLTAGAKWINVGTSTVANLPAAATAGNGARAFVTDALAPTFGTTVAGSGAVSVPVYSDGTNWKVG